MKTLTLTLIGLLLVPLACLSYMVWFNYSVDTSEYNYSQFTASQYTHGTFEGPTVGESSVDFTLLDVEGNKHSLQEYAGKYVVIETGSLTCPQYVSWIDPMNALMEKHPDVAFLTIYVREAHPGSNVASHSSLKEKLALAGRLRNEENESRPILVDTLEGDMHRSYGAWPNMVYVVAPDGEVAFRGLWNNADLLEEVVEQLKSGQLVNGLKPKSSPNALLILVDMFSNSTTKRVLSRAGGHATSDFVLGGLASLLLY